MNRRRRRAEASGARERSPSPNALTDSLRAIHAEAGGALNVYLVSEADALALILDALEGSRVAAALLRAASDLVAKTRTPTGERPLCLACPAELTNMRGVRVGLAAPSRADPSMAIAFALCPACGTAGNMDDRVLAGLRCVWPGAQRLVVTHPEGGRA